MKRGAVSLLVLGILAIRADAGDNPTVIPAAHSPAGFTVAPLMTRPRAQLPAPAPPAPASPPAPVVAQPAPMHFVDAGPGCSTCNDAKRGLGRKSGCSLWDYLCFRPTVPAEWFPNPTPYTPPLRAWFYCREQHCCDTCGMCGKQKAKLPKYAKASTSAAGCNGCGAAALGAPVSSQVTVTSVAKAATPSLTAAAAATPTTISRPRYTAVAPSPALLPERERGWKPVFVNSPPPSPATGAATQVQTSAYAPMPK